MSLPSLRSCICNVRLLKQVNNIFQYHHFFLPLPLCLQLPAMQAFKTHAPNALRAVSRRSYATASGYETTAHNLRINKDTRVMFQGMRVLASLETSTVLISAGFTGKQGSFHAQGQVITLLSNTLTAELDSRSMQRSRLTSLPAPWTMEQTWLGVSDARPYLEYLLTSWLRNKSKESRPNTSWQACLRKRRRLYEGDRRKCQCNFRTVRSFLAHLLPTFIDPILGLLLPQPVSKKPLPPKFLSSSVSQKASHNMTWSASQTCSRHNRKHVWWDPIAPA